MSTPNEYTDNFKSNLICIFPSFRAKLKKTLCPRTLCIRLYSCRSWCLFDDEITYITIVQYIVCRSLVCTYLVSCCLGCVVSSLHNLHYYIYNDDFFLRKITKLKRILGNKKTVKRI